MKLRRGVVALPAVGAPNTLWHVDALELGRLVAPKSADLAYLDPPFKVEKAFGARLAKGTARAKGPIAYDDTWGSLEAYLSWLEARIAVVHGVLSERGTMWLHLDQRAVHEAKLVCDGVFGTRRFRGEVIWVPGNGSKSRTGPGMSHQTMLVYARGKEPIWNAKDPALRAPFAATSQAMHFQNVDADGRRYRDRVIGEKTYRYYADEGRALGSVWTDCPSMAANTPLRTETTGYPTQKPLKLLDRIVRASSTTGSLVVDPFCGSGTTLDVARDLNRRALGYDVHPTRKDIFRLDARKLPPELTGKVDFVFMDPPYSTHLDYGPDPRDIGKLDAAKDNAYYEAMEQAFAEAHRLLKAGKHLGLYVSDSYIHGKAFIPLGLELFTRLRLRRFEPVDIIAVTRHNKTLAMGNYRKAADEGNFFLRGFNYLFIMRK